MWAQSNQAVIQFNFSLPQLLFLLTNYQQQHQQHMPSWANRDVVPQWFSIFRIVLITNGMTMMRCFANILPKGCHKFNRIGQIVVSISLHASEQVLGKNFGKRKNYKKSREMNGAMEKAGKLWYLLMAGIRKTTQEQKENCQRKILHDIRCALWHSTHPCMDWEVVDFMCAIH